MEGWEADEKAEKNGRGVTGGFASSRYDQSNSDASTGQDVKC
jgi:hypothetical protein